MVKYLNLKNLEWEDIKRTVARTPQILKQKARIGSHTVDEEFESLHEKFLDISYNADLLLSDVKRYNHSIRALIKTSSNAAKAFEELFHPCLEGLEEMNNRTIDNREATKRFEDAALSADITQKYLDLHSEIEPAIIEALDLMMNAITPRLINLSNSLANTKKFIKKRNNALLEYDACIDSIEKLEVQRGDAVSKTQNNLFSLKRKEFTLGEAYRNLNTTLKKELPYLFVMVKKIVKPILLEVYYSQKLIYRLMMKSTFSAVESGNKEFKEDLYLVSENSLARQLQARKRIESLSITCFRETYLKDLTSDNLEVPPPVASQTNRNNRARIDGSTSEMCVALYDFKGTEKGDLSFHQGDHITILSKDENHWWTGSLNGKTGQFPYNYVTVLSEGTMSSL